MMDDFGCGRGGLDNSGFHYDDCAGGPCDCDSRRYGSVGGNSGGSLNGAAIGVVMIILGIIIAIIR